LAKLKRLSIHKGEGWAIRIKEENEEWRMEDEEWRMEDG
jgi:hypothetical protein